MEVANDPEPMGEVGYNFLKTIAVSSFKEELDVKNARMYMIFSLKLLSVDLMGGGAPGLKKFDKAVQFNRDTCKEEGIHFSKIFPATQDVLHVSEEYLHQ
eukprot:scaffold34595_cov160-Amphora_coffeaeformis.AAC.11